MRINAAIAAAVLLTACEPSSGPIAPPDERLHRQEILRWRSDRIERLRDPDGWLSLVGLYWLEAGESGFGSDPANALVIPGDKAAPFLGAFHVDGKTVRLEVAPEANVTLGGEAVSSIELRSDQGGEPTVLESGDLRFHLIERGGELGIRLKDRESETLRTFTEIETYPVDPVWRVVGELEPYDPPRSIPVPNILGRSFEEESPGAVSFKINGETYRLDALPSSSGELFLVFGDRTNGHETYGGGRFLYAAPPTEGQRVVLDFNKAYNPPCVFTTFATCPLPPPQNKLALAIEAGEKVYGNLAH